MQLYVYLGGADEELVLYIGVLNGGIVGEQIKVAVI